MNEIKKCYVVSQPLFFAYSSRAELNPNDFMTKLGLDHDDLSNKHGGYILNHKQYQAMLYKAGIRKTEQTLSVSEQDFLEHLDTTLVIEELERRTRAGTKA